jgi:lycopene cyclase domain-containing protein
MSNYWTLNLFLLMLPLLGSFHPKLQFYKRWKFWVPAVIIPAVVFIFWDVWFTAAKVWTFNPEQVASKRLVGVPMEQVAFFFLLPFAAIFMYELVQHWAPKLILKKKHAGILSLLIVAFWLVSLSLNLSKLYPMVCFALCLPVLTLVWYNYSDIIRRYLLVYVLLFIPLMLLNSFFVGSLGGVNILSYSDVHQMGVHLFEIPIENFSHNFLLILMGLLFVRFFEEILQKK